MTFPPTAGRRFTAICRRFANRADNLHTIGRVHGEANRDHPTLDDPLADLLGFCYGLNLDPAVVLSWPDWVYRLYRSYVGGRLRGERVKAARR